MCVLPQPMGKQYTGSGAWSYTRYRWHVMFCYKEGVNSNQAPFKPSKRYQVARIVRIVLNDGGHALLVGVGGSGKQSLSRLAAFICGYSVSQIVISSTYAVNDLKEDLKSMYNKVSLQNVYFCPAFWHI